MKILFLYILVNKNNTRNKTKQNKWYTNWTKRAISNHKKWLYMLKNYTTLLLYTKLCRIIFQRKHRLNPCPQPFKNYTTLLSLYNHVGCVIFQSRHTFNHCLQPFWILHNSKVMYTIIVRLCNFLEET